MPKTRRNAPTRRAVPLAAATAWAVVTVAMLAACSDTRAASGTASGSRGAPATQTPAASQQLPIGEVFLADDSWKPASTGRAQALNPCLRQPLNSLGADTRLVRAFNEGDGAARAQEIFLLFHSENAAEQAFFIFTDWHQSCRPMLGNNRTWKRSAPTHLMGAGEEAVRLRVVADGKVRFTSGVIRLGRVVGVVTIRDETGSPGTFSSGQMMKNMLLRAGQRL